MGDEERSIEPGRKVVAETTGAPVKIIVYQACRDCQETYAEPLPVTPFFRQPLIAAC